MRRLRSCADLSRPECDERHADSSIAEIAFETADGTIWLKKFRVLPAFLVWTIVAGEDDERLLGDTELLEFVQQPPYIAVEPCNHGSMSPVGYWPILIAIGTVVGHLCAVLERSRALVICMRYD